MEKIKYVNCDRCGRPIIKGNECINDKVTAGIYCSVLCWAYDKGQFVKNTLNEEVVENCYLKFSEGFIPLDTKRYSNIEICDSNEDEEMEKLAELIGTSYSSYQGFFKAIDDKYKPQIAENEALKKKYDFIEWCSSYTKPCHSVDYNAGSLICRLAYEFANGYMIFEVEEPI